MDNEIIWGKGEIKNVSIYQWKERALILSLNWKIIYPISLYDFDAFFRKNPAEKSKKYRENEGRIVFKYFKNDFLMNYKVNFSVIILSDIF